MVSGGRTLRSLADIRALDEEAMINIALGPLHLELIRDLVVNEDQDVATATHGADLITKQLRDHATYPVLKELMAGIGMDIKLMSA